MNREDFFAVHELGRQGLSVRAIARRLKLHRRSVRRALSAPNGQPPKRLGRPRPSLLDPHRAWVQTKLEQYPQIPGRRLWRMLSVSPI
jgi:transposase